MVNADVCNDRERKRRYSLQQTVLVQGRYGRRNVPSSVCYRNKTVKFNVHPISGISGMRFCLFRFDDPY